MEVTKWLKPQVSVSRIGDNASVQAVTRVNAEQSSKRTMRRPTRQPFRGRLIRLGEAERRVRPVPVVNLIGLTSEAESRNPSVL